MRRAMVLPLLFLLALCIVLPGCDLLAAWGITGDGTTTEDDANGDGTGDGTSSDGDGTTPEKVATPSITPTTGEYTEQQTVSIACSTTGAEIYYTLDDATPSASSNHFTATFTVSATTTVKAIATKDGMTDSDVATSIITITPADTGGNGGASLIAGAWKSISTGSQFTAAVKDDGTLWAWGANLYGQIGDGTSTNATTPQQIGTSTDWATASAGDAHVMAVKTDGTLWAWGANTYADVPALILRSFESNAL